MKTKREKKPQPTPVEREVSRRQRIIDRLDNQLARIHENYSADLRVVERKKAIQIAIISALVNGEIPA